MSHKARDARRFVGTSGRSPYNGRELAEGITEVTDPSTVALGLVRPLTPFQYVPELTVEQMIMRRHPPAFEGYVYFIRMGEGPIKIGISKDPATRMRGMQPGSPEPLALLRRLRGHSYHEWRLHYEFREHRLQGEWFKPCEALLELVESGHYPDWWDTPLAA